MTRHELWVIPDESGDKVEIFCACDDAVLQQDIGYTLGELRRIWDQHLRDAGVVRALEGE